MYMLITYTSRYSKEWCRRWDSNPRPTGYESVALPIGATPASPLLLYHEMCESIV